MCLHTVMTEYVVVHVTTGSLRGRQVVSELGSRYVSFQGIPYAKPPIGQLRFKAPVPVEPWSGVRDALTEGNSAPSLHMLTKEYITNSSEDCLYINVYTRKVTDKKPVMVWIHGGGFAMGSGNTDVYGPDYLLEEDVVIVTFNYRLGPLGFLSLETTECPGNYGLKDMVMALKWVKENICNFGGDPQSVTIFGESAGSAAVNYLMLSPSSAGLFHRAIGQSGSSLNPWAFQVAPKKEAAALAKRLGCTSNDEREILEFLKNVPADVLVKNSSAISEIKTKEDVTMTYAFVPCVEPNGADQIFLCDSPGKLIKNGQHHDVPYLRGVVSLEGLIVYSAWGSKSVESEEDYFSIIPSDMVLELNSQLAEQVITKIKHFYFPNGFETSTYVDALSDVFFVNGIHRDLDGCVSNKSRTSPTFCYQFCYDKKPGVFKKFLGHPEMSGVSHGDELSYLFKMNITADDQSEDLTMIRTMTKLWTNFAKTADPTDKTDSDLSWDKFTKENGEYLEIDENLTKKTHFYHEIKTFWDELYKFVQDEVDKTKIK